MKKGSLQDEDPEQVTGELCLTGKGNTLRSKALQQMQRFCYWELYLNWLTVRCVERDRTRKAVQRGGRYEDMLWMALIRKDREKASRYRPG
ncbi:MAG TPA: hypothetical protein GYA06_01460 [Chloroflexi bacterium]|nr:hypothetical protein [Chloroflexota bacterium]HPO58931.1 hypothetical protein [Anaerolineaceae bacterium]